MAKREHLNLLRQGVVVWNEWREKYPDLQPDLSHANLRKIDLSTVIPLQDDHTYIHVNLSHANLREADFGHASLLGADFSYSDLREAYFGEANLSTANFSHVKLSGGNLIQSIGISTNFSYTDLSHTSLSNALFYMANLRYANLHGADLSQAHFLYCNLEGANFSEATLGLTTFGNVDLQAARGLETVKHNGPSVIGTNTLMRSRDSIPEVFLRGTGMADSFIDYARSLVNQPIQYYTCFISYSSKDKAFVKCLYADLQSNGVRCWFAPENLKWGQRLRSGIDEAIHLHEKLLLVLSKYSIASGWVEHEVKTALAKERKEKRTVLYPIRLDRAIFDSPMVWATEIRHKRNIGDFTGWKTHDEYQKAFTRLLHDLKSEAPRRL